MAVAGYRSSSITMKAVVLPVMLVLRCMAVAVAPSFASAPVTNSEASQGRRLLATNLCGAGSAPNFNCSKMLPQAKMPACCPDANGSTQSCYDVGSLDTKCGSCANTCLYQYSCCNGICTNLQYNQSNCGKCGLVCPGTQICGRGVCRDGF